MAPVIWRQSICDFGCQELRRNIDDRNAKDRREHQKRLRNCGGAREEHQKSLDSAVARSRVTNQAQVQLSELESKALTSRTTSDKFLQIFMEAAQQRSLPISQARMITPAAAPANKSHPKALNILIISAASGIMIAFGIAVLREASNRVFRTSAQVEGKLHVRCLAIMPLFGAHRSHRRC